MAGNKRHLKFGKSKRVLRGDDKSTLVVGGMRAKMKRVLPYSF